MIPLLPRLLGWPLKLPLSVVVVYEGEPSLGHVSIGHTVASQVTVFYKQLGIRIQPRVSARILPRWPRDWMDEAMKTHYYHLGGHEPTLIVRSDLDVLPSNNWGKAFGSGLAVSVGQNQNGTQHDYLAEIAIHELGHLLDLSHESGTFMHPHVEKLREYEVTPEQREKLRETAYRYGGL